MSRPRRVVRVALALLALAAASCAAAGGLGRGRPAQDLARLDEDWRAAELASRPDLASLHGDHRGDSRLEPVTQASLAAGRGRVDSLQRRLDEIPSDALSPRGRAVRDSLARWIAESRAELDSARWERDPGAYLDLAGRSIETLVTPRRSPCMRLQTITRRLRGVPEALRAARVNLREVEAARIEASLPGWARVLSLYRRTLPDYAEPCREAGVVADLAEADTSAVRAVQEFVDYLRNDLLPHAR